MKISVSTTNSNNQVPPIVFQYNSSKKTQTKDVKFTSSKPKPSYSQSSNNNNSLVEVRPYGQIPFSSNSSSHGRNNSTRVWSAVDDSANSDPTVHKGPNFGVACFKFLRPYAVFGTALGTISVFARAVAENPSLFTWSLLIKALPGLIATIFGNAYYTGINQIYDIDIDRVNKPDLPIPAGELSVQSAWLLVIFYLIAGLSIVGSMNSGLVVTSLYAFGLFLGTIYSIPPLRLKKFSISTFLTLATIRGILLNIGVYYATRAALGLEFIWSPSLAFICAFVTLFILVISITKDLTDVEGDAKFGVITFASTFGVRNIALLGSGLLLLNYVGATVAAIYMPEAFKLNLIIPAHAILAVSLASQAWVLELANYTKEASASFYRFIWILLFVEYIIFPFI